MGRLAPLTILLALCAAAPADEVVLRGGGRLSGEVVELTDEHVRIRLANGTMLLPRGRVLEIVRESRADWLRREAAERLAAGDGAGAVALFERVVAADPRDGAARTGLGRALEEHARTLLDANRGEQAGRALARLEELEPGHAGAAALRDRLRAQEQAAERLREQGLERWRGGDLAGAARLLDQWRRCRPVGDESVRGLLARLHLETAVAAVGEGRLFKGLDQFRIARAYGEEGRTERALFLLRPVAVLEALRESDLEGAGRLLDGIETTYPDPAVPRFLQAVVAHVGGRLDEAAEGYAEAARIASERDPPAEGVAYDAFCEYAAAILRIAVHAPPLEGARQWRETFLGPLRSDDSGRHFTVHARSAREAERLAGVADRIYERIAVELLGRVPDGPKAELIVHPGREAYLAADPAGAGSPLAEGALARKETAGVTYVTLDGEGHPLVRVEVYEDGTRLELDTLPHEMVHVVQRRGLPVVRKAKWLDEGLAILRESDQARAQRMVFWRHLREQRIPLPEFFSMRSVPAERAALFYSQALAFTAFLRDRGDEQAWTTFLDHFAASDLAAAVEAAYGIQSLDELERLFERGG